MTSTVRSLFVAAGVSASGVVRWRERIPPPRYGEPGTGVYVVALTDSLDSARGALPECPLSREAVQQLLDVRPELTLDGERPEVDDLAERLAAFWCPDEVVVYIGRAGPRIRVKVSELSGRVAEFYTTSLGARSPHAGGWPIKTLANLGDLFVQYAYCDDVATREQRMLDAFAAGLSAPTRKTLHDAAPPMPFANLESAAGRKAHGIKGARRPGAAPPRRFPSGQPSAGPSL